MTQTMFTVDEIRNYIDSQDSLGDIAYKLSAENIVEANKEKVDDKHQDRVNLQKRQ
jgi:hypothetical protein